MSKKTKELEKWREELEKTYAQPAPKNNVLGKRPATRSDHGRAPVTPARIQRAIETSREKESDEET